MVSAQKPNSQRCACAQGHMLCAGHLSNVSNVYRCEPSLLPDAAREAVQNIHNVVMVVPAQSRTMYVCIIKETYVWVCNRCCGQDLSPAWH